MREHILILGEHAQTPDYDYSRGDWRGSGRTFRALQYCDALMCAGAHVIHLSATLDMARHNFDMAVNKVLGGASDFDIDRRRLWIKPSGDLCRAHGMTMGTSPRPQPGSLKFFNLNITEGGVMGMGTAIYVPDHHTPEAITHEHQRDLWAHFGNERARNAAYASAFDHIKPPHPPK